MKQKLVHYETLPPIEYLRERIRCKREALGIKQRKLAELVGVQRGTMSKIESGRMEPSYKQLQKILEVLESLEKEERVEKFMKRCHPVGVQLDDTVGTARRRMVVGDGKGEYSQLVVWDGERMVGSLTMKDLMDEPKEKRIREVRYGEPFPTLSVNASRSTCKMLLYEHPAVVVTEGGRIVGIVTPADLWISGKLRVVHNL
ncbi:MAG: helix-turn-helix domain-containing protein [Candidatus Micrarchaeia archaeon]